MRNSVLKYLTLSIILLFVIISCVKQNIVGGSGVLMGKISIGPLCPVETIPPDPNCLPTLATYKSWASAVWALDKSSKIATLDPKLDGTYEVVLPTGNYIIDFDATRTNNVGGANLPSTISIANGDTTSFNINIDTGIR
jgi:hypothetical protein